MGFKAVCLDEDGVELWQATSIALKKNGHKFQDIIIPAYQAYTGITNAPKKHNPHYRTLKSMLNPHDLDNLPPHVVGVLRWGRMAEPVETQRRGGGEIPAPISEGVGVGVVSPPTSLDPKTI